MLHPRIIRHYLDKNQGIAEYFSHLPNRRVEKITHMGEKLQQEAVRLRLKPAQVAKIFEVEPPSVYDWYQHGRIHKKHYPRLEEWSGKSIRWWLDFPEGTHVVAESPPDPFVNPDPRHKVLLELFDGLPRKEQDDLIRTLTEKKQHYDAVIEELLSRRQPV